MEIESKLRIVIAQPVSLHRISLLFFFSLSLSFFLFRSPGYRKHFRRAGLFFPRSNHVFVNK